MFLHILDHAEQSNTSPPPFLSAPFHPERLLAESPVADNLSETGSTAQGSAPVGTVAAVGY